MWKESYRIGVDIIDSQHKALFARVEGLMAMTQQPGDVRDQCTEAVAFLKEYVVRHFADEEAYQRAVGYADHEKHRRIHAGFVETVLDFERKMVETNFEPAVVKQFVGMLITWLIYHVASEDRRYIAKEAPPSAEARTYQASFAESMKQVFATLTGSDIDKVTTGLPSVVDHLYVKVGLVGAWEGEVVFVFPKQTAFALIEAMTFMEVDAVDDMVVSALCEVSNIISGNAASVIAAGGIACDITPPVFLEEEQELSPDRCALFTTGLGNLGVVIQRP